MAPPDEAELAPPRQFHAHLAPPAGAGTSCNFPGRASFVAAKDRTRWGQNFFANDLGGARRTWTGGAETSPWNQPAQAAGPLARRRPRHRPRPRARPGAARCGPVRPAAPDRPVRGGIPVRGRVLHRIAGRQAAGPDPARPGPGPARRVRGHPARPDRPPGRHPGLVRRRHPGSRPGPGRAAPPLAGQPGLPPAAALLDHAAATAICQHAAAVADDAARRLRDAPPGQAADIARAAADILYAAADATGNRDLRAAADGFGRAARAPWGPVPAPTPPGNVLRTAAYLITATAPGPTRRLTRHALTRALASLAAELARLRHAQQRPRQADAARTAAAALTAASHTPALDPDGLAPAIPQATAQAQPAARRRPPTAGPPKRGRSR